jgi:hypothetical protein
MWDFWVMEPPLAVLYKAVHFVSEGAGTMDQETKGGSDLGRFGVSAGKNFDELPHYMQLALISHSGLSEPEFHKQRIARRKKELLNAAE